MSIRQIWKTSKPCKSMSSATNFPAMNIVLTGKPGPNAASFTYLWNFHSPLSTDPNPNCPNTLLKEKNHLTRIHHCRSKRIKSIPKFKNTTSSRAEQMSNSFKLNSSDCEAAICTSTGSDSACNGFNCAVGRSQRSESTKESYSWSWNLGGRDCFRSRNWLSSEGFLMIKASLWVAIAKWTRNSFKERGSETERYNKEVNIEEK